MTTALMTLIINESAHFFLEKLWGFDAVMRPLYGSNPEYASNFQKIVIAVSGPLLSLFQGLIFLFISARFVRKNIASLFTLWMAFHGFILFFGYVICSPFFLYSDTGQLFYLLHFPLYLTIVISALFLILMIRTLRHEAEKFTPYGRNIPDRQERNNKIILYPLIIGGIITFLVQLPVPHFLLLFSCLTSPLMFLIVYGKLNEDHLDNPQVSINRMSVPLISIFLLIIVVTRLLI